MAEMFETNGEEVARELLRDSRIELNKLQGYLREFEKALQEHTSGAFSIGWVEYADEKLRRIGNDIARANGAVLVRAVETKKAR